MQRSSITLPVVAFCALVAAVSTDAAPILLDFGRHDGGVNGEATVNPSLNGKFWNNLSTATANAAGGIPIGTSFTGFVDSANNPTTVGLVVTSGLANTNTGRWEMNGYQNGGLLTPDQTLLGDFAVKTITGDYWFTLNSGGETFNFTGLNPTSTYDFKMFATRDTGGTRTTQYEITGLNAGMTTLVTSGPGAGSAARPNGNDDDFAYINGTQPTASGLATFRLSIINGGFAYVGAMQITEHAIPEPNAVTLLGLVGVASSSVGRRRHSA